MLQSATYHVPTSHFPCSSQPLTLSQPTTYHVTTSYLLCTSQPHTLSQAGQLTLLQPATYHVTTIHLPLPASHLPYYNQPLTLFQPVTFPVPANPLPCPSQPLTMLQLAIYPVPATYLVPAGYLPCSNQPLTLFQPATYPVPASHFACSSQPTYPVPTSHLPCSNQLTLSHVACLIATHQEPSECSRLSSCTSSRYGALYSNTQLYPFLSASVTYLSLALLNCLQQKHVHYISYEKTMTCYVT